MRKNRRKICLEVHPPSVKLKVNSEFDFETIEEVWVTFATYDTEKTFMLSEGEVALDSEEKTITVTFTQEDTLEFEDGTVDLNDTLKMVHCSTEITHLEYDIGMCQHAEAICYARELMYGKGEASLTEEEWEACINWAKEKHPNLKWEEGGYGKYEKYDPTKR